MKLILSVLLLFHVNGFLLSIVILGFCWLCKIILHKKTWTELFDYLGLIGLMIIILISLVLFTTVAYFINHAVFLYLHSKYAVLLSWILPVIIDGAMMTQVKRGKEWLVHGDTKNEQETIYK